MVAEFYKYQGTGNDFIIFDNRSLKFRRDIPTFYSGICDRRFGIGADGVMLLQNAKDCDFEMVYFNADGREGSLCGNGSRCIVKFAELMGIKKERYVFRASDGLHDAIIDGNVIKLKMHDVHDIKHLINYYEIDTGSPHYVEFMQNISALDIRTEGAKIRHNETYKQEGINVNFVEALSNGIAIRTYERGVEDETFSCGTGVTAAAIIYSVENKLIPGAYTIPVKVLGGDLKVSFEKISNNNFTNIWLIGPAKFVFNGEIEISF
ncbi:MAG: diaminopimelate epimerase [Fimbriimonadaceae bacterium]|nr:diaminopimelate epimerase [Chitinophagales bacterium]